MIAKIISFFLAGFCCFWMAFTYYYREGWKTKENAREVLLVGFVGVVILYFILDLSFIYSLSGVLGILVGFILHRIIFRNNK